MKNICTTIFLIVVLVITAANAQNREYTDVPNEQLPSTPPTVPATNNPPTAVEHPQTNGNSRTKTASVAVRVIMGIFGVICYELKECRESLDVRAATVSTPSQTNQIPYTSSSQYDLATSKYAFTTKSNASASGGSSTVQSQDLKTPTFYYRLAADWSASRNEKAGKVTIYPHSQQGLQVLKTVVIMGLLPISSGSGYNEAQNYLKEMVENNRYLSNSAGFGSKTIDNRQCYYKQLAGFSKDVNANETVSFFGCQLDAKTMFYSVVVYNDKTTAADKQKLWQISNSIGFAK